MEKYGYGMDWQQKKAYMDPLTWKIECLKLYKKIWQRYKLYDKCYEKLKLTASWQSQQKLHRKTMCIKKRSRII